MIKIDTKLIGLDLCNYYGYEAKQIVEVKGGTVGYTYAIDDRYFLKIYDTELANTKRCTEKLLEQLTVLDRLQNSTLLKDRICYPTKTVQGEYFYAHDNIIGVLFNLIEGSAIGYSNRYTKDEILQLAEMVKVLHEIECKSFENLCPQETFNLEFCDELNELIENNIRELPEQFYELVKPHKTIIVKKIIEVKNLAQKLKQMQLPFVLCHTDIHGGNIMRNKQGKLILVDWENVILAPKEADLFAFCEEEYFHYFKEDTNEMALFYYVIRRDLEDIWEFLSSMLNNEYNLEEQMEVFGHMKRILEHLSKESM
ncbi:MAG: phosphotransferase family protein [Cellulosilyticaceae bacterium]